MNQRQQPQLPEFIRALNARLRGGVRDQTTGIYYFSRAIEDMFVMLGITTPIPAVPTPEFVKVLNENKFLYIRKIQSAVKAFVRGTFQEHLEYTMNTITDHNESDSLSLFDLANLRQSTFQDLVTSFESAFLFQGSVIVKLLYFLTTLFGSDELFRKFAGRYPLKVIINIDGNLIVPQLINNAAELRDLYLDSFFRLIASADFYNVQHGGTIDYNGDHFADDIIPEYDEFGNPENDIDATTPIVLDRLRGDSISILFMQYSRMVRGRQMPSVLRLPEKISRSVINPNNADNFCLIYCLIIASKIMYQEKIYKAIKNKLSINKLEAFPVIAATFDEKYDEFIELYDDEYYIQITPDNIDELEKIFDININVYTYIDEEKNKVDIIYRSSFSNTQNSNVARLLYVPYSSMRPVKETSNTRKYKIDSKTVEQFQDEIGEETFFDLNDGHFCLLPLNSQFITGEKVSDSYLCCSYCDTVYRGVKIFEEHKANCLNFIRSKSLQSTKMIENPLGACQKFTKYHTLSKSPFVIYGDTETQTNSDGHKLFSFMLYAKHYTDPSRDYYVYDCARKESQVGDGMIKRFMEELTFIRMHIKQNTNLYPELDPTEVYEFEEQNIREKCKFCGQVPINKHTKEEDPDCLIVHHDHNIPSPNIVGFLCQSCNIKESKINKSFPLVFHNLPYDLLVLIKILTIKQIRYLDEDDKLIMATLQNNNDLIANTSMKYSTMTLKAEKMHCQTEDLQTYNEYLPEIRFIDSCAFVKESLEKIITMLKKDSKDYKKTFSTTWRLLQDEYPTIAEELFQYSTEKGVIAYSHTTIESMNTKTNLSKHQYKSDLDLTDMFYENIKTTNPEQYEHLMIHRNKREKILDSDYDHSNKIFEILKKQFKGNMTYKEYFMFYLKLDVCLLTDFFEWFRDTLIPTHRLDPAWYIGLPSYSQNCMLLKTEKTLHFIEENLELSKLITANLRGGLSVIINKMAENMAQDPLKHIAGIDINNLYGYSMQMMKIANRFLGEISVEEWKEEAKNFTVDGDHTYFLLTDYDASDPVLQDLVAQLPPLVSKKNIDFTMLSANQKDFKEENYRSEKLCCTVENGEDYLMLHDNYLFYTRLGYKVKVKKVFKFEKEFIYKDYIEMNSALRQASKNDFAKALLKLLNNIIYGKSLQRNDLNTKIEILSDKKLILKRLINPRLKRVDIIKDDELVMTNTIPQEAKFDTCCQAGFNILELSKLHIYSMLYEKIIPFCKNEKVGYKLLLSDTDSIYLQYDFTESKFENYNQYMLAINNATGIFDMHTFADPLLNDMSRKKQVGLFLDEEGDTIEIIAYVGLCSKSYCYLKKHLVDSEEFKAGEIETVIKGKGISTRYLKAMYTFEDYFDCAKGTLPESKARIEFNNIQRKNYQNVTTLVNKVALSAFDDKMYHYKNEDGVWESLPHGHYKIAAIIEQNTVSPENSQTDTNL